MRIRSEAHVLNSAYGLRRHRFMPHFVEDSSAKWSEFWNHLLLCQKVGVVKLFFQKRSKESHQKLKQDTWWFQENCVTLQNPFRKATQLKEKDIFSREKREKPWRNSSKLLKKAVFFSLSRWRAPWGRPWWIGCIGRLRSWPDDPWDQLGFVGATWASKCYVCCFRFAPWILSG